MKNKSVKQEKVIVALDVQTYEQACELVKELSPVISCFKIGSELFTAAGPRVVEAVRQSGAEVFLDLKFHDIPNTVAAAIRSASELDVFLCNVHASGGQKMMEAAAKAARESKSTKLKVIAVTVLTSMTEDDLRQVGVVEKSDDQVLDLAHLAKDSGLHGVVCSGREATAVRNVCGNDFLIVTPGVRPEWAASGDQVRVVTPTFAFEAGADYIVVGRPITEAASPIEAAEKLLEEIK